MSTTLDRSPTTPTRGGVPHRRLILVAAAVVVLVAALVWVVAFSPVLGVRTVSVTGTDAHLVTTSDVLAAARLRQGTALVRLDARAVQRRVAAIAGVADVTVRTSFPSTVRIAITERVAVGTLQRGTGWVLVDATGVQFRVVATRPAALPLFVYHDGADTQSIGRAVARVAGALPARLRATVTSVQAFAPDAITLLLSGDRVVRWGSSAQSPLKAHVLRALLRRGGSQFDLTDPHQPFTR